MFRAAVGGTTIKPGKVPSAPMTNLFPANVIGCRDPGIAFGNREVIAELATWLLIVFKNKSAHKRLKKVWPASPQRLRPQSRPAEFLKATNTIEKKFSSFPALFVSRQINDAIGGGDAFQLCRFGLCCFDAPGDPGSDIRQIKTKRGATLCVAAQLDPLQRVRFTTALIDR